MTFNQELDKELQHTRYLLSKRERERCKILPGRRKRKNWSNEPSLGEKLGQEL